MDYSILMNYCMNAYRYLRAPTHTKTHACTLCMWDHSQKPWCFLYAYASMRRLTLLGYKHCWRRIGGAISKDSLSGAWGNAGTRTRPCGGDALCPISYTINAYRQLNGKCLSVARVEHLWMLELAAVFKRKSGEKDGFNSYGWNGIW